MVAALSSGPRQRGDADRDRDFETARTLLDRERFAGDPPAQTFGHHGGDRHVGFRHHDDEFLAAIAAGEIDIADRLADAQRELAQHIVAGIVAVAVVDRLEIIDVEHQHRDRLAARGRLLDQRPPDAFPCSGD